jgi:Flp pilus assembly protein TadD
LNMVRHRVLAALGAGLVMAAGGWLLLRPEQTGAAVERPSPPAWDATHEKAFLAEQLQRNPKHTPILLRLAQMERADGDLAGARRHLEEAVAADGSQVDVRLELSLVCSETGDLAEAEQQNQAVLRIAPGQPDALYNLGAIAANRGDSRLARQYWMSVLGSARGSDAAAKSLAGIQRLQGAR